MTEYREQPLADVLSMASHEFAWPLDGRPGLHEDHAAEPPPLGYSQDTIRVISLRVTRPQSDPAPVPRRGFPGFRS